MTKVALRGLLGRKTRALLTAFAIILGVAMVSGTFVLTDTIKAAFNTVFTTVYQNTDAVITGKSAISSSNNGNAPTTPSLPASLLTQVRALPSVAEASGSIRDSAQLVGRNGKVISSGGGGGLALSYSPAGAHFNPLTLKSGQFPQGPQEINIDASTASKHNYKVGDEIGVVARGPVEKFRIAGTVQIGGVSSLGGATIAVFTLAKAQQIFNKEGQYDAISVAAKHGSTPQQVVNDIKPLLGPSAQVRTGQAEAQQASKDTSGFLNIFQDFLLAFG
ncbi:MAG: ABC transporter permease, partial [Solirubrobacterales bacterium]|nr:ABC transporter permease [Solirubrobacterales bacterium]